VKKLPKLEIPYYKTTLPSSDTEIHFRPFIVKEQKILQIAAESKDPEEIFDNVKSIIAACVREKINVDDLPPCDIEWLFIKLRSKSVGETIDVQITCDADDCGEIVPFSINLNDVKILKSNIPNVIQLDDNVSIKLKYPSMKDTLDIANENEAAESISHLISMIFTDDSVYMPEEVSKEDLIEFINCISSDKLAKIKEFITSAPKLLSETITNCPKCGKQHAIKMNHLTDFF